ncbi:MAG: efflux RND transporter permease subunit [Rhodobacteraceae bacterium]|nr:efflux RND transporter permease subunit [Paracoccaceae bacterium]
MSIARLSIDRPLYTWIIILTCLFGGLLGFLNLGRLEDPAFTIKTAVVYTLYPGASAETVAREVSETLESVIQRMSEVKEIRSRNEPGISLIYVDMDDTFDGTELPRLWTKLREKVGEARLPEGAGPAVVNDGFGDVFGLYYAVSAPGYSDAEIYDLSHYLRRELLAVNGVADVALSAVPSEVINVEPNLSLSANLGISPTVLKVALANANTIGDAGSFERGNGRTLIRTPEGNDTLEEISGLTIGIGEEVISMRDFASVTRARDSTPDRIIRHNGTEAFTIGVAGLAAENIVAVGQRVDDRLAELGESLPIGVVIAPIYRQHVVVEEASNAFLVNLAMSVGIVVVVLALFMGARAAIVVGSTLLLTVVGTLLFMWLFAIEMERISLGALIIAMGMLVDNAIVVAEGMQVAMSRGLPSRKAAEAAASKTQIPLLGATVIAILAFAGIGLSNDATGEYLFSLFAVIAIALLLSWGLALTVTPLLGHYVFKQDVKGGEDAYSGPIFRAYRTILEACLKVWWLVIPALIGLTVVSVMVFGQVRQQFFPFSNTPLFFVHYQLTQGASIHETSADLAILEDWLLDQPETEDVTAYVGGGAGRFLLTYQTEDPNPGYGHLIVRTSTTEVIPDLINRLTSYAGQVLPQGETRARRLAFGPGGGSPIQVRFSGPDLTVLRYLAEEAVARLAAASDDNVAPVIDWREQEQVLRPVYAVERAQQAGISRDAIAETTLFATTGINVGVFREGERQIPIILRSPRAGNALNDQLIWSEALNEPVPFEQVTDGLRFEAQDTLLMRRDRVFTITVSADIAPGLTANQVQQQVQTSIEEIEIPRGFRFEWGGELESSADAQQALGGQLPVTIVLMILVSVLLFNALRQPVIIWLLVPMSLIGVSFSLYGTGLPFSFTALLGLLSLAGMLIKNGIVLVSEIDNIREAAPDQPLSQSISRASVSRMRPVMLAAATTILGMTPLIRDAFFQSMAVAIMGGLAFATALTLIAAPVLYFLFFGRNRA